MARPYGSDWGRWPDDRRRWSEGEEIRSAPGEHRDREAGERYEGTRDMDFGGGYGGGEARGGGGRGEWRGGFAAGQDRDRGGSRGGGWMGGGREDEWRQQRSTSDESWRDRDSGWRDRDAGSSDRESVWRGRERDSMSGARWIDERDRWSEDRSRGGRDPEHYVEQGRGGGYQGGWGGEQPDYGSSTGGYGASGLTGSTGRWGPGGAGYSGAGESGGYGQAGSRVGERYARGEWQEHPRYGGWGEHRDEERWRSPDRDDRGLMDRMGDTLREGMEKLTGRGPKGYKRSDERIREDVCERLARSGRNAENVEVQVENGEVTLSGEVENRADKRHLEDMIEDVFGVDEVHNHLRLRRETPRSSAETSSSTSTHARGESDDAGLPH